MHLITGKGGSDHITSSNDGFKHAQIFGKGSYVFKDSDAFSARIIDNNTIEIGKGQGIHQGRLFENESATNVVIENGTTGYSRIDLIVARYSKNVNNSIEQINLIVIKGTKYTDIPVIPSYNEGSILDDAVISDFPLYEVQIASTRIQKVKPIFEIKDNLGEDIAKIKGIEGIVDKHTVDIQERIKKFYSDSECDSYLPDSDEGLFRDMKIYARVEQTKYDGYNLIPYPYVKSSGYANNGITYTIGKDGIVIANGTATADSYLELMSRDSLHGISVGASYALSGAEGGSADTYKLYASFRASDDSRPLADQNNYNSATVFTIPNTVAKIGITILIKANTTVTNKKFKPMLVKQKSDGTYPTAFEPYTQGKYSPSPSYPQELRGTTKINAEISNCNLIPYPYKTKSGTVYGISFVDNGDGTVTANGTATNNLVFILRSRADEDWRLENGTYFLNGCPSGGSLTTYRVEMGRSDESGNFALLGRDLGNGSQITINNYEHLQITLFVSNGAKLENVVFKPMLVRGTKAKQFTKRETIKASSGSMIDDLRAVPVQSGGNVVIDGQHYFADYIDLERKKIVRWVDEVLLNGSNMGDSYIIDYQGYAYLAVTKSEMNPDNYYQESFPKVMSKYFRSCTYEEIGLQDGIFYNAELNVYVLKMASIPTSSGSLTDWQNYLTVTEPTFWLPRLSPIEENLTDSEIWELLKLKSFYGGTNISLKAIQQVWGGFSTKEYETKDSALGCFYPVSMESGWEYVKSQIGDTRETIYNMRDLSDEAYINAQYAEVLATMAMALEEV